MHPGFNVSCITHLQDQMPERAAQLQGSREKIIELLDDRQLLAESSIDSGFRV